MDLRIEAEYGDEEERGCSDTRSSPERPERRSIILQRRPASSASYFSADSFCGGIMSNQTSDLWRSAWPEKAEECLSVVDFLPQTLELKPTEHLWRHLNSEEDKHSWHHKKLFGTSSGRGEITRVISFEQTRAVVKEKWFTNSNLQEFVFWNRMMRNLFYYYYYYYYILNCLLCTSTEIQNSEKPAVIAQLSPRKSVSKSLSEATFPNPVRYRMWV